MNMKDREHKKAFILFLSFCQDSVNVLSVNVDSTLHNP